MSQSLLHRSLDNPNYSNHPNDPRSSLRATREGITKKVQGDADRSTQHIQRRRESTFIVHTSIPQSSSITFYKYNIWLRKNNLLIPSSDLEFVSCTLPRLETISLRSIPIYIAARFQSTTISKALIHPSSLPPNGLDTQHRQTASCH